MSDGLRPAAPDVREREPRDERSDRDHRKQQVGIEARVRPWHVATVALGSLALAIVTDYLTAWAAAATAGAAAGLLAASRRRGS